MCSFIVLMSSVWIYHVKVIKEKPLNEKMCPNFCLVFHIHWIRDRAWSHCATTIICHLLSTTQQVWADKNPSKMGTIKAETWGPNTKVRPQLCTIGHGGFVLWPHTTRIKNLLSWNPVLVTNWIIKLKAFRKIETIPTSWTNYFNKNIQPLATTDTSVCIWVRTSFIGSVSALGSPDSRVGRVWAVLIDLISSSVVLLANLCQVVHTEATQLLCDGSLTLSHTRTQIDFHDITGNEQFRHLRNKLQHAQQLNTISDCSHHLPTVGCCWLKKRTFKAVLCEVGFWSQGEKKKSHD